VGAIPLNLHGQESLAEFLHTIPGLDTNDPDQASVEQEYKSGPVHKLIQVLTPVSLVLCKLHALRHFNQANRQDELASQGWDPSFESAAAMAAASSSPNWQLFHRFQERQ
jgi:hypothetical protein